MAMLHKTDGTIIVVKPENGTDFQLEEMYKLLDVELIQIIPMGEHFLMVCDDEGKLQDDPQFNLTATIIYWRHNGPVDEIYGNVLVCEDSEVR